MSEKEFNQIFSERLKYYMRMFDMTQADLAKRLKVGTTSVSNWCLGIKTPRMDKVDAICEIFHCKRSDLINEPDKKKTTAIQIPVLGRVAAGYPLTAVENIIDMEEISADMVGDFVGLQIHGDSMEPRMRDGDVVIVRRQADADSGDTVIAMINGDEATCKKLIKHQDGITLVSTNTKYDPMYFSNKEIQEKPITIFGKVVELRAKF